ncbi:GNAT family N-acetyltransferase [Chryseobacterium wangxinyae]|uniref:GNAT family N-acetyltransferase n=1 Tax=Chryseobacterium sp. CY350 TaxID=2997336 RepID=UPI0022722C30|nr:GNAT family N-acetyltransferase [Chryseobacterium sp. CY350]MCY0977915.1 GNAT family N-acetyltransferase [Chryseobacterium sp. CY350]WBZ95004.1 GNAT family N-acetyltransferase [Chryseobacterium sp. CY350]
MTELKFYQPEDLPELDYVLDEIQSQYTATAKQALEKIEERNQKEDFFAYPITIFFEEKVAGFFVLDFGDDKYDLTENPDSVLLRSLSVNPELQGRGIGKSSMAIVDNFIEEHFSDCNEIVLAVNEKNTAAFQLYTDSGYKFDGKTREGRSGPQFLLFKKL